MTVCKIFVILPVLYFSIVCETVLSQSRFEIDISAGYSRPMLEAYGTNVIFNEAGGYILVNGKRLLVSDNLGTDVGYSVQACLKYKILDAGYIKAIFNLGYNILYSVYEGSRGNYGVRIQTFSIGTGVEASPLSGKKFYPSLFGLLRTNFIGGESYYVTGYDYLKVTPRFGYAAGFILNYSLNKKIGLFLGYSYNYDNLWNKQTEEAAVVDEHTISFRDKVSPTNGLNHDRRIVYWSLFGGIKFYLNL